MTDHGGREGQQLDNYRLLRQLGQGAFGEVYLAENIHRKRLVAVKVLHTRLTNEQLHAFLNEARIFRLKHPHIVSVLDFGVERTSTIPFLVMDYAPNGTLRQRHPAGTQVPLPMVVSYVKQVAEALQYAHEENLIHRDIKPANLLIGQHGEILVSDFGISIITQGEHISLQSLREVGVSGSPSYMAPEQWKGKASRASDQYALGITVYEWLSGVRPFDGDLINLAQQHANMPPPSLLSKVPSLPPDVERVVLTALAKDPKQRFASVRAFAIAFEQAAQVAAPDPLVPPFETLLNQSPQSSDMSTPSRQSWQPTMLPDQPSPLSPSNHQEGSLPHESQPLSPRRTISRRTVLASLVGLGLIGGTWLVLSQNAQKSLARLFGVDATSGPTSTPHSRADPTPHLTPSPTKRATPMPSPTPHPTASPGSTSIPVTNPTPTPRSQVTYKVTVITGDVPAAGTDANVYISLYGDQGSSTDNHLDSTLASFEKGQTDVFYLTLVDLGNLQKITIYHDNTGVAPGWYLDRVIITNTQTTQQWTFVCDSWLARDEGDGSISRTIYAS